MTKNFLFTLAIGVALSVPSAFATTTNLPPGGSVGSVPGDGTAPPPGNGGGTVVAQVVDDVITNNTVPGISVTVWEDVVLTSGGTYDFYYAFENSSSINDSFNTVDVTNYTGFSTSVGRLTGANGVGGTTTTQSNPSSATRDGAGDTVNFLYTGANELAPGQYTPWLEIVTNATAYNKLGTAGAIDGGGFSGSGFYEPVVPEPMTMGLFGGGLALLGIARWRRRSNKP